MLDVFRSQDREGHHHFLHRKSAMLEGVAIELHIVVVVIGISKEARARGKDVSRGKIRRREFQRSRVAHLIYFFCRIVEIFSQLIAQVRVHIAVTHHFAGAIHANRTVVSGQNDLCVTLRQATEEFANGRMAEPRERDGTIGGLIGR